MLLGGGLGGFTTVNNTAIMGHAGDGKRGFASGMVETTRQLGHSVGVTLSSTIMAGALVGVPTADLPSAYASGFQQATLLMGGFTALALLSALVPYIGPRGGAAPAPGCPPDRSPPASPQCDADKPASTVRGREARIAVHGTPKDAALRIPARSSRPSKRSTSGSSTT